MPIYEYQCPKCGTFELMQRITESALKKCPTCKSKIERLMSRTSFVLKGSGWYATDYARTTKPESKDAKGAAKSDSTAANGGNSAGEASGSDSAKSDSTKSDSTKSETTKSSSSEAAKTPGSEKSAAS
jgi:putative FmdB family regulatory protein